VQAPDGSGLGGRGAPGSAALLVAFERAFDGREAGVRWDNLRLTGEPDPAPTLFGRGVVTRRFDTPEFRGMTFYEVQARTIINRVPAASRVPFTWTINPYRGCSHACVYCLSGDTPVLLGDGTTRALAEVAAGDVLYGTRGAGSRRRYVHTEVLAHWETVKPAYRLHLQDGRQIVASGDHRFLTSGGWKHVTGTGPGGDWRPYLAVGDRLVGPGPSGPTGDFAESAVERIAPLDRELPMYDITTVTGDFVANGVISHNCFARNTHTYLDLDAGHDFDSQVVVKVNAPELLRRELAAPSWQGEHIAMGTNVDCYQRAEGRYQLMRGILAALRDAANPFSILTKGSLLLRDLDLLRQAAAVTEVGAAVSVGFLDRQLWRAVEPGTPSPRRRLDMVRKLSDAGFAVSVLMAPILPGLTDTDEAIEATVAAIARSGAASVTPLPLHLRPGAREWYMAWLTREFPDQLPRYRELYGRGSYARKAYQEDVVARVRAAAARHGLNKPRDGNARRIPAAAEDTRPEQLSLL
jgi:DNA repair photolyase